MWAVLWFTKTNNQDTQGKNCLHLDVPIRSQRNVTNKKRTILHLVTFYINFCIANLALGNESLQ